MARKTFATVGGTHRQAKKIFATINGVYRKMKKAFVTRDGVYRQCFSSDVKWHKYDAVWIEPYYQETLPFGGMRFFLAGATTVSLYENYEFSAEEGYMGTNGFDYNGTNEIVGLYYIDGNTDVYQLDEVCSSTDSDWPIDAPVGTEYMLNMTQVASCYQISESYECGEEFYGEIIAEDGDLPEDGTLIEGAIEDGYCVLDIDGTYYYYAMQ